jgi:hypothetical protein
MVNGSTCSQEYRFGYGRQRFRSHRKTLSGGAFFRVDFAHFWVDSSRFFTLFVTFFEVYFPAYPENGAIA